MTKANHSLYSFISLFILGATVYLTIFLISPPQPIPANAPSDVFSAERAMQDLEIIAKEPHPMGAFPAHAEVRDYLLGEIRLLGLEPQVQKTIGVRVVDSGWVIAGSVENILVRLPGTDPDGAILLSSHYDSTPGGPGAGDSGSGIVTILELLRALRSGEPLRHDVIFFFSDGEEPGTVGAHAFVAQHPWFEDVRIAINMDQVIAGPPMLVRSSQGNGDLIQAFARSATSTKPAFISFPFDLFPGGDTDLLPFEQAGVLGAEIDSGGSFPEKHTSLDRPDVVDPASLQQAGDQMLALVRSLGNQTRLDMGFPDQTFFPVMGMLVHYPSRLAWPLAILAGLAFLGTMLYGFRKRKLTWRGIGMGFLTLLVSLAVSVMLANLVWRVILVFHPEYAYVSASGYRQMLSGDFLYATGFFVLALAVTTTSINVIRKKISTLDLTGGVLVIWFLLTLAVSSLIPPTSYLCTWVLVAGSLAFLLALAVHATKDAWLLSGLGYLVSAVLATFLWVSLFYIAILAGPMSPDAPLLSIMLAAVALWLGALIPTLDWIVDSKRWVLPTAAVLVGVGFLLAGHFLVGKDSPPPLVNPVGYWMDADEGKAYWIAFSDELDERQSNLLVAPTRRSYTELLSEAPHYSVLTSAAPLLDFEGPRFEVLMDEWDDSLRMVKARIYASMHDRVYIIVPEEFPVRAFTLPYDGRTELPPINGYEWVFRFDGMPEEGIEITFEFTIGEPIQFLLVEEKTGLPSFPGLSTQPEPGTMKSPGEFYQGIPTDFTALYRDIVISENNR